MSERELVARIDAFIEELIALGTLDSAAVASILLATRAALRDGLVTDAARALWRFVDQRQVNGDDSIG